MVVKACPQKEEMRALLMSPSSLRGVSQARLLFVVGMRRGGPNRRKRECIEGSSSLGPKGGAFFGDPLVIDSFRATTLRQALLGEFEGLSPDWFDPTFD